MSDFKQILCALDLSDSSDKVLEKAKHIVQKTNISLTIMHIVESSQFSFLKFVFGTEDEATKKSAITKIDAVLSEKKSKLLSNDIKSTIIIEEGNVSETINSYASKIHADLLIIGAHRNGALQNLFLGSNALKILRSCSCPVLAVKNESSSTYQRVLIGVDFSQNVNETISIIRNIAPKAEIVLAHFFEIPFEGVLNHYTEFDNNQLISYRTQIREEALKKMEAIADASGLDPIKSTIVVVQGDAVEQMLFFANDYECDLLVLGKHGMSLTEEFIIGSVTNQIINTCTQDILVIAHQENK